MLDICFRRNRKDGLKPNNHRSQLTLFRILYRNFHFLFFARIADIFFLALYPLLSIFILRGVYFICIANNILIFYKGVIVILDFDYVRLISMLFSGLITAVMVIVINESLNWFRVRRRRRGLLILLVCELIANETMLTRYLENFQKMPFRYTVWEKSCVEFADFLSEKNLTELSAVYYHLHLIEVTSTNSHTKYSEVVSLIRNLRLTLGKEAGVDVEK